MQSTPNWTTLDLNNGSVVLLSRPNGVVQESEDDHATRDGRSPVHGGGSYLSSGREEGEDGNDDEVDAGEDVVGDAQSALDVPRAPDELSAASVGQGRKLGGAGHAEARGATAVEQQGGAKQVRAVKARDGERQDSVQGGVGTNVDEAEEDGDDGGDENGVEGNAGAAVDGGKGAPERNTAVASEGPEDARARGHETDVGAEGHDEDQSGHEDSSGQSVITNNLLEDTHVSEARGVGGDGLDIGNAEEEDDNHDEAGSTVDHDAEEDGAGNDDGGVLGLLGHVESSIDTDEGKDVTHETDEEGQAVGAPATAVVEGSEDLVGICLDAKNAERDEDGEETDDVQDENGTLKLGERGRDNGVDEGAPQDDGNDDDRHQPGGRHGVRV